MNAIDYMIEIERDGLQLYETLDRKVTNIEFKEIFSLLADSQRRHLSALENIKSNLAGQENNFMDVDKSMQGNNGFRRLLKSRDLLGKLENDQDAFWHIVTTEDEVIKVLEGVAANESHRELRRMLEQIVKDEKEHLSKIENIYEFVETPHSYLEWGEFSNLHPL